LDPRVGSFFRRIISAAGHEVVSGSTVAEGVQLLTSSPVDLVFLDMAIGAVTALEVMLAAREADVPIVAIPGVGPDGSEVFKPTTFGAVAVLSKPFSTDEIRSLVLLHARGAELDVSD
jgi:DNA-binding response OmpR family regulator